ncbi:uncharacterized protein LOC105828914 [Monomorium pharaonis]|uniref:uncharacterized protein LOC105828914 n=1 Tax=Monomorium pharaonis TaxID=307658 RepID=UPI00063EFFD9|nr:uncharacterized protein LOC105828914 [Monomorium pharaonis]
MEKQLNDELVRDPCSNYTLLRGIKRNRAGACHRRSGRNAKTVHRSIVLERSRAAPREDDTRCLTAIGGAATLGLGRQERIYTEGRMPFVGATNVRASQLSGKTRESRRQEGNSGARACRR